MVTGCSLREPVESAESLGDEVEESSAGVSPLLPVGGIVISVENGAVQFISDGPQLVGHSPDLQLLHRLFSGPSVAWRRVLILRKQIRQRSTASVLMLLRV